MKYIWSKGFTDQNEMGIWSAGIDVTDSTGTWGSAIECHGFTKPEAELNRDLILLAATKLNSVEVR